MLKSTIRAIVRKFFPSVYWSRQLRILQSDYHEPELHFVGLLADASKTSIDVGAAGGVYVAHMLKASKDCVAFEPGPNAAISLNSMVEALRLPVKIERVALSNQPGTAKLRVLTSDLGRSTIESENQLEDPDGSMRTEVEVPVRKLDDYSFDLVGFIKIDVEGHEIAVIEGASEIIKRQQPNILIEVEDRHKPASSPR